jgi:hypothetical protein
MLCHSCLNKKPFVLDALLFFLIEEPFVLDALSFLPE